MHGNIDQDSLLHSETAPQFDQGRPSTLNIRGIISNFSVFLGFSLVKGIFWGHCIYKNLKYLGNRSHGNVINLSLVVDYDEMPETERPEQCEDLRNGGKGRDRVGAGVHVPPTLLTRGCG